MDYRLTEDQESFVTAFADFVDKEIVPRASDVEAAGVFPMDNYKRLAAFGYNGLLHEERYGGTNVDALTATLAQVELARGCASTFLSVGASVGLFGVPVREFASDEMKSEILPGLVRGELVGAWALTEPHCGSDVAAMKTTARKTDAGYVLSGSKMFITNGRYGDLYAIVCKTDSTAKPAYKGISIVIAEKGPGLTVVRDIPKLGYRGIETTELAFDGLRVLKSNLLGGVEGQGFQQVMRGLELGRVNVAARAVGVARAALADSVRYAQQRHTFGKPIAQHQAIQQMLADMATDVQAAHLLVVNAAEKMDRGERADLEAGMAKLYASEACLRVATQAMRIHGGVGYTQDLPIERYFRDAPLMIIGEGTSEIQRQVIARRLIEQYPGGDFLAS